MPHIPIYTNLSLTKKLTMLLVVVGCLSGAASSYYTYRRSSLELENILGKRLEHIARTAALMISGEQHVKIVEDYVNQAGNLTTSPHFKEIQSVLKRVHDENGFTSDIYTLIRPDWQPDMMVFVAMSGERTYVGNGLPLNLTALHTLQTGTPSRSGLYRDKEGIWLSAFAPIKTADGKVVAALEVDFPADGELAALKKELLQELLLSISIALVLSTILGGGAGRALARPVVNLAAAAREISKGNLFVEVKAGSGDEVGLLGQTFNEMTVELRKSRAALEDYSHNLEKKVEERTAELNAANRTISAMINSLSQGFVVFERDGRCLSTYSMACEALFEGVPAGKYIWDLLKQEKAVMAEQVQFLFEEPLPFRDIAELCPRVFTHSEGKRVELGYYAIRNDSGAVSGVVVVATDKTKEHEAMMTAEREQAFVSTVVKLIKYKNQFYEFVLEERQMVSQLKGMLSTGNVNALDFDSMLRIMHTLKGGASAFALHKLAKLAHDYETELSELKDAGPDQKRGYFPHLAKNIEALELEMETFLKENRDIVGHSISTGIRHVEVPHRQLGDFAEKLGQIPGAETLQREFVETFVKEPVGDFVRHYDGVLWQIASASGKQVKPLELVGADLRIVSQLYTELFASLVHAFRNAVDHGLESAEERRAAGKDPAGKITVSFAKEKDETGEWLRIAIDDDGRGIDTATIKRKLIERDPKAEWLSDDELLQQVFQSGFSTKREASMTSGRGVGMSAILAAAEKLGGTARVTSQRGRGSTLTVRVPYRDFSLRSSNISLAA